MNSTNPFTKVNGNLYLNNFNFVGFILPSALADGLNKSKHFLALAAFLIESI